MACRKTKWSVGGPALAAESASPAVVKSGVMSMSAGGTTPSLHWVISSYLKLKLKVLPATYLPGPPRSRLGQMFAVLALVDSNSQVSCCSCGAVAASSAVPATVPITRLSPSHHLDLPVFKYYCYFMDPQQLHALVVCEKFTRRGHIFWQNCTISHEDWLWNHLLCFCCEVAQG